jgi:hypothetical protein
MKRSAIVGGVVSRRVLHGRVARKRPTIAPSSRGTFHSNSSRTKGRHPCSTDPGVWLGQQLVQCDAVDARRWRLGYRTGPYDLPRIRGRPPVCQAEVRHLV